MKNKADRKLTYTELKDEIHLILMQFFSHEITVGKDKGFDFQFMKLKTDDILKLIKKQGGTYEE